MVKLLFTAGVPAVCTALSGLCVRGGGCVAKGRGRPLIRGACLRRHGCLWARRLVFRVPAAGARTQRGLPYVNARPKHSHHREPPHIA